MTYEVSYQQHKYSDLSDNPPLRCWHIKAENAEQAFRRAQLRAVNERARGRKIGVIRREMRTLTGIEVASGNRIEN